ncbi:hypothetical protein KHP62_07280 [Rhodobacteraceae bacterium NNCM2]|nr:hypothetical protein [Coraliihabitans acroporae]
MKIWMMALPLASLALAAPAATAQEAEADPQDKLNSIFEQQRADKEAEEARKAERDREEEERANTLGGVPLQPIEPSPIERATRGGVGQ